MSSASDWFDLVPPAIKWFGSAMVPVLSALAAYKFGIWRARYDQERQATQWAVERLLKPLSTYIGQADHPVNGLEGFDEDQVAYIARLLHAQDEYLDAELGRWKRLFDERSTYSGDMTAAEARRFAAAVALRYHRARRRLGLPYDREKAAWRPWRLTSPPGHRVPG